MDIDIILVNYHSASDLAGALGLLTPWPHGRIWVVDNSCDAGEAAALRSLCANRPEVQLHNPTTNLGFGKGCNLAWGQSTAEFVLLLNPDARIRPDHILRLATELRARPHWAAVSPKTYWDDHHGFVLPAPNPQSPWQGLALSWPGHAPGLARWLGRQSVAHTQAQMSDHTPAFEVSMLSGAVLLLRRRAVDAAGGLFDPDYFMFFEDADLSIRLRQAGWTLGLVPACEAVHTYRHKPSKAPLMLEARQVYFRKHHAWFGRYAPWLDRLSPPHRAARDTRQVCRSPEEWRQLWPHAPGVMAFSPSLGMRPAICRPSIAQPWTDTEWGLLEPGVYAVLIAEPGASIQRSHGWVTLDIPAAP